jgi:hypothetical protein
MVFIKETQQGFLPIILLEFCFHLAGVTEIYVTSVSSAPINHRRFSPRSFWNRLIASSPVAVQIHPLRMGVDEAGTGRVSKVLQFTIATGVTLAIVRKAP